MIPLIHTRMDTLTQGPPMIAFLFTPDDAFAMDPDDAAKVMGEGSAEVLTAARTALAALPEWTTDSIEAALREALIDGLGRKPKVAFGPVRVAVTGRRISPPLFESLELLGRDSSLRRLDAAVALTGDS